MACTKSSSLFTTKAQRRRGLHGKALFGRLLLRWYDANKRDLPWRKDRDPYRVWISEIMLQQTRVAAVVEYYRRFLEKFPDVHALAAAKGSSVLAAWSGLGYYCRARALHEAARVIVGERDGKFPQTAEEWETLPGIGRYTAAAVASIAFGQRAAVVDGNVQRVLSRIAKKQLTREQAWSNAGALLSRARPGDFNQALMELGATVCVPRDPKCLACPVMSLCRTRGELPSGKKEIRRKREIHYALNHHDGEVLLVRRPDDISLMPGMWELPEVVSPNGHPVSFTVRHSITVTDYTVRVTTGPHAGGGQWVHRSKLSSLPLTGLTKKILRRANII